jgi:hypothetical protein
MDEHPDWLKHLDWLINDPKLVACRKRVPEARLNQRPISLEEQREQFKRHYRPDVMDTDERGNPVYRVDEDGVPIYLKPPHAKSRHLALVVRKFTKDPAKYYL